MSLKKKGSETGVGGIGRRGRRGGGGGGGEGGVREEQDDYKILFNNCKARPPFFPPPAHLNEACENKRDILLRGLYYPLLRGLYN